MAIQSVNKALRFQKGISLIELMMASAIGIIALLAVGSVFSFWTKISDGTNSTLVGDSRY